MKAIINTSTSNKAFIGKAINNFNLRIVNLTFIIVFGLGHGIASTIYSSYTPPAPINIYWIGGSGDWDDVDNWAKTSGGSGLSARNLLSASFLCGFLSRVC